MEEKILISGKMSQKTKIFMVIMIIGCFAIALRSFLSIVSNGFRVRSEEDVYSIILAGVLFTIAMIFLFIYFAYGRCEIIITEQNVKGKARFGNEVVLPIYKVSAYSTRKLFSTIAVATSSGVTKFAFIKNYAKIGEVLSKKINERQENTAKENTQPATQNNSIDDILKLKNLLDAGIITQEEFDEKKKQLLSL